MAYKPLPITPPEQVSEGIEFYINYAKNANSQTNGKTATTVGDQDLANEILRLKTENAFLKGQVLAFEKAMIVIEKLIR